MSNLTVEQMASEIIKIEEESLKKKLDVNGRDRFFGKSKIDSDAVNKILAVLDAGGISNED